MSPLERFDRRLLAPALIAMLALGAGVGIELYRRLAGAPEPPAQGQPFAPPPEPEAPAVGPGAGLPPTSLPARLAQTLTAAELMTFLTARKDLPEVQPFIEEFKKEPELAAAYEDFRREGDVRAFARALRASKPFEDLLGRAVRNPAFTAMALQAADHPGLASLVRAEQRRILDGAGGSPLAAAARPHEAGRSASVADDRRVGLRARAGPEAHAVARRLASLPEAGPGRGAATRTERLLSLLTPPQAERLQSGLEAGESFADACLLAGASEACRMWQAAGGSPGPADGGSSPEGRPATPSPAATPVPQASPAPWTDPCPEFCRSRPEAQQRSAARSIGIGLPDGALFRTGTCVDGCRMPGGHYGNPCNPAEPRATCCCKW